MRKTSFEWVTANTSPAQRMLLKKCRDVEKTKSKKLAYSILRPILKQSISPQSNRLCVTFFSCSCYGVWATTTATATRTAKNCNRFFNIFFCRCWATIAWKCSIFRLVEDMNSPSLFTDPLFSLLSPSSARDKKKDREGFIDRQRKEVMVGEEQNRRSVNIFGSNWNLPLPRKANYHWLNGDYPVIIMSTTNLFLTHRWLLRSPMFSKRTKREIKQRLCAG